MNGLAAFVRDCCMQNRRAGLGHQLSDGPAGKCVFGEGGGIIELAMERA